MHAEILIHNFQSQVLIFFVDTQLSYVLCKYYIKFKKYLLKSKINNLGSKIYVEKLY